MNILVLIRAVRDPAGFTVSRRAQKIFVNREQPITNPSDKNALEATLTLKAEGDTLIVVAIGDAPGEDALREARAMDADRAVLVRDEAFKNADAAVMTAILQRLIHYLGSIDLVVFGEEALDSDLAQVGPRLAEALGCPFLSQVYQISTAGGAVQGIVHRWGAFQRGEVDLPAVLSVARDSNKPRYAPSARIINVYQDKAGVELLTAADLQLTEAELAPLVEYRGESFPPERELGKRLEGSPDEMARQLAEVIRRL